MSKIEAQPVLEVDVDPLERLAAQISDGIHEAYRAANPNVRPRSFRIPLERMEEIMRNKESSQRG